MATIKEYFEQAQLAQAAYGNFNSGLPLDKVLQEVVQFAVVSEYGRRRKYLKKGGVK